MKDDLPFSVGKITIFSYNSGCDLFQKIVFSKLADKTLAKNFEILKLQSFTKYLRQTLIFL